jgi:hypothetical protein
MDVDGCSGAKADATLFLDDAVAAWFLSHADGDSYGDTDVDADPLSLTEMTMTKMMMNKMTMEALDPVHFPQLFLHALCRCLRLVCCLKTIEESKRQNDNQRSAIFIPFVIFVNLIWAYESPVQLF